MKFEYVINNSNVWFCHYEDLKKVITGFILDEKSLLNISDIVNNVKIPHALKLKCIKGGSILKFSTNQYLKEDEYVVRGSKYQYVNEDLGIKFTFRLTNEGLVKDEIFL